MQHEQLWAPWRLPYIQGERIRATTPLTTGDYLAGADHNCFLCQGAADRDARAHHVVHRSEKCLTVLNRYPYNNGHLLVAPQLHRARLDDLTPDEQSDLFQEISRMVALLERVLTPQGFNVGLNLGPAAGAGLPGHLHWHIVPRWTGDTNFMSTLAAVRIIPQALEALWETLTETLAVRGEKVGK